MKQLHYKGRIIIYSDNISLLKECKKKKNAYSMYNNAKITMIKYNMYSDENCGSNFMIFKF